MASPLVTAARALVRSSCLGAPSQEELRAVAIGAGELLATPGADGRQLRDHGARIASALLSLEHATPTLASARCWRILAEALDAERLAWDASIAIPPVPAHAHRVMQ